MQLFLRLRFRLVFLGHILFGFLLRCIIRFWFRLGILWFRLGLGFRFRFNICTLVIDGLICLIDVIIIDIIDGQIVFVINGVIIDCIVIDDVVGFTVEILVLQRIAHLLIDILLHLIIQCGLFLIIHRLVVWLLGFLFRLVVLD